MNRHAITTHTRAPQGAGAFVRAAAMSLGRLAVIADVRSPGEGDRASP